MMIGFLFVLGGCGFELGADAVKYAVLCVDMRAEPGCRCSIVLHWRDLLIIMSVAFAGLQGRIL
jgi:hypothetical protein